MTLRRSGSEHQEEALARVHARVYGDLWRETAALPLVTLAERIMFDLDDAVTRAVLGRKRLRFAIVGRRDHLCIDVFGLADNEINTPDGEYTDQANVIRVAIEAFVSAYNHTNPNYAWDVRFTSTVRLLCEAEQWSLRNAAGAVDVRHYPY